MALPEKFNIIIPPPGVEVDPGCLQQLAAGSEKAFNWLYINHCRQVFEYALLLTGDEALSEDIVQDVFCRIWKNRAAMAEVRAFSSYLNAMSRNRVHNYWRKMTIEKNYREQQRYLQAKTAECAGGPEELDALIYRAVERLPRQQKIVYRLKREEKWKRTRIAETLKISPETVKAHMQKALRSIRDYLRIQIK